MHVIWFSTNFGTRRLKVEVPTTQMAREVWDALQAGGFYMASTRP